MIWSWLKLNCAELWPSRNWVWDHWFKKKLSYLQWIWKGYMFAGAMQRMLSEGYSLRLLQEARESKTQILVSWDLPEVLQFPPIHMVLNSVQQFFHSVYTWYYIRLCDLTTNLCKHSFHIHILWPLVWISKDISLVWNHFIMLLCCLWIKKTPKQTAVSKLSYFNCLNCSPLHLVWTCMDRKFDQVLSLQQLDKSKAISQILQEVTI